MTLTHHARDAHRPRSRRWIGVSWACLVIMAAGGVVAIGGCSASSRSSAARAQRGASAGEVEGRTLLDAAARDEQVRPRAGLEGWSGVPGVSPEALVIQAGDRAGLSVDEVFAKVADAGPRAVDPGTIRAPAAEDKASALKLYVRGVQRVRAGEVAQGLRNLEDAVELDPSSHELAARAGLVLLERGRRSQALTQLRRAVVLGSSDPRVLWRLGREEARSGREDASLSLLLRARELVATRRWDPMRVAIEAELGEQLANAGYSLAARDVLESHLQEDGQALDERELERVPEAIEALRRRASLLMLLGDVATKLGDNDAAQAAYGQAVQAGTLDATAGLARLLTSQVRSGKPAQAAITLLEDIERRGGVTTPWHADAARALCGVRGLSPALPLAVDELCTKLGERATPAVRRRLMLIAASVSDDARATTLILRELAGETTSEPLLSALAERSAAMAPSARIDALRRVMRVDPLACDAIADAVLAEGRGVESLVKALRESRETADVLLLASMLRRLGLGEESLRRVELLRERNLPAAVISRIASLSVLGREGDVEAALATLTAGEDVASRRVRAMALDLAGRPGEALASLAPDVEAFARAGSMTDLLFAADLAVRANEPQAAVTFLSYATQRDALDERAYEGLVVLSMPGGGLPSESRLAAAMQGLRRAAPSSRTVQWLLAQESVQRGLLQQAKGQLQALISETGEPEAALDLLLRLWEHGSTDDERAQGAAWLRARIKARPESTNWLLALTRLLVRMEQASEARALLRERLAIFPVESLMLQAEFVVRDGLKQPEEADRLAVARLRAAPRTPARAIALAESLLRLGDSSGAVDALRDVASSRGALTETAAKRLIELLERATRASGARAIAATTEQSEALLDVFDAVATSGVALPVELSLRRIELLATARPTRTQELIDAILAIGTQEPRAAGAAMSRALLPLLNAENPSPLLRFLGMATFAMPSQGEPLAYEWLLRTAAQGSVEDMQWLLAQLTEAARAELVLRRVGSRSPQGSLAAKQADVAYAMGNFASLFGRQWMAMWAYRACLERDHTHAWAANNLGFFILEYGGDIEEARGLITKAHDMMPEESSIIDSYGWLKYKLGEIADSPREDGGRTAGAASILLVAASSVDGRENDEVLEHAGDALWRRNVGDDRAQAVVLWKRAAALVQVSLEALQDPEPEAAGLGVVQLKEQRGVLQRSQARLEQRLSAIELGNEPEVAPLGIPAVSTLSPEPAILTPVQVSRPASEDAGSTQP